MLKELHEVIGRIETLSKEEHELIREVHPAVGKIKESMDDMTEAAARDASSARGGA